MKKAFTLAAFALALGLLFLEALLRIDGQSSQTHRWLVDLSIEETDRSRRGRPETQGWYAADDHRVFVDLDENGWRRVPPASTASHERRIVLLGGPSLWGKGVGQEELLSTWLAAESPPGTRVENRGTPNAGFASIRSALERLTPDPAHETTVVALVGATDMRQPPEVGEDPWASLEEVSLAARFLHERWLRFFEESPDEGEDAPPPPLLPREQIAANVSALLETANARGVELILAYVLDGDVPAAVHARARAALSEIAQHTGTGFIDLLDQQPDSSERFSKWVSPRLGTWTPRAHFRAARRLLDSNSLWGEVQRPYDFDPEELIGPDHPYIQYSGRIDATNPAQPRFDWAGVKIRIRIRGDSVRFFLHAPQQHDYFDVRVDGHRNRIWLPGPSGRELRLDGLGSGIHDIEIIKRTDGIGPVFFDGIWLPPEGEILPSAPPPTRRILALGASWAHGYGNEGTLYGYRNGGEDQRDCADSRRLSNAALSWPMILGDLLEAEVHLVSKGGAGVVRNYEAPKAQSPEPLPIRAPRTLSSAPDSRWDTHAWQPDLVVINLGENDFTLGPQPSEQEFLEGYLSLLGDLRDAYPNAFILTYNLGDRKPAYELVGKALQLRRANGDDRLGHLLYSSLERRQRACQNHPSVEAHHRMAAEIADSVRGRVSWTTPPPSQGSPARPPTQK